MTVHPAKADKLRCLPYVMAFDVFNAAFCQLTVLGSVFILFLSELGLRKAEIGMVLSLVPFASMGAILLAPLAARIGVKRVFLTFWGTRNFFAGAVMATPWVCSRWGLDGAFIFVAVMMACFSCCRAFGEAANTQWRHEIIPANVRGRFSAVDNIACTLAGVGSLLAAGLVMSASTSITRYLWLMGVGTAIGLASILWASKVPGGGETQGNKPVRWHVRRFSKVLRDRNFLLYVSALSLVTFGSAPLAVFVPLFLKEEVGIEPATVVLVLNGAMVGALLSSYFWGWAADRFGSKPVILSGLVLLLAPPLGWLAIPYGSVWSIPVALVILAVAGCAGVGYTLGTGRQLYVSIVPPRRKTHYMSVFCAWMGVTTGLGQLLAGASMDMAKGLPSRILGVAVNPYTFLFLFTILMLCIGLLLQRRVEVDGSIPMRRFVGMFLQGNPVMAVDSLLRYNLAGRDVDRVALIRRLGRAYSPLSADELAGALADPSFSVRYEAIIAIARTRPDPRLTADLIETLISGQPDLSIAAAWALARVGDPAAIPPLRWVFSSQYPVLQLRCARALASLSDTSVAGELQRQIAEQTDPHMRRALASVLQDMREGGRGIHHASAARLEALRRAGDTGSLLAGLADADFNVRYEAIVLASQHRPAAKLTSALVEILLNGEPDLSIEAAWALSLLGDPAAVEPLTRTFHSGYPLLQGRSARALAGMGETHTVPEMRKRLAATGDPGLRLAYASSLGELRVRQAVADMVKLHDALPGRGWVSELNLALAKLVGDEGFFIRLWRRMRSDPGTVAAGALHKIAKRIRAVEAPESGHGLRLAARHCIEAMARDELGQGARGLADVLELLPRQGADTCRAIVQKHCVECLRQDGPNQAEAVPLAIHCLHAAQGRGPVV